MIRRVAGSSMSPTLKPGRLVIALKHFKMQPGDIVIARATSGEVVKRVSRIDSDIVELVGDNTSQYHNTTVGQSAILGKVII